MLAKFDGRNAILLPGDGAVLAALHVVCLCSMQLVATIAENVLCSIIPSGICSKGVKDSLDIDHPEMGLQKLWNVDGVKSDCVPDDLVTLEVQHLFGLKKKYGKNGEKKGKKKRASCNKKSYDSLRNISLASIGGSLSHCVTHNPPLAKEADLELAQLKAR